MERGCRNCMWLYHMVTYNPTAPCSECIDHDKWHTTKSTNADRIRTMTDEELAEFLWSIGASPFNGAVYINGKPIFSTADGNKWLDWLRQEAEDG